MRWYQWVITHWFYSVCFVICCAYAFVITIEELFPSNVLEKQIYKICNSFCYRKRTNAKYKPRNCRVSHSNISEHGEEGYAKENNEYYNEYPESICAHNHLPSSH